MNLSLHVRERHAVIGGDDDQRVLEFARCLEQRERPADLRIAPLHLHRVVEQVAAHDLCIGQVGRDFHVFEPLAEAQTGARLIDAMRLEEAHPETKRLPGGFLLQERLEIRGVIRGIYSRRHGHQLLRIEGRPRGIARAAGERLEIARTPALARQPNRVTGPFQQIGVDLETRRKHAAMRHALLELPGISAGENARPAWAAFGVRGERVLEQDAFPCNPIEVRRADPGVAVDAGMRAPAPIVEDDEKDVWPARGLRRRGRRRGRRGPPREDERHHAETQTGLPHRLHGPTSTRRCCAASHPVVASRRVTRTR